MQIFNLIHGASQLMNVIYCVTIGSSGGGRWGSNNIHGTSQWMSLSLDYHLNPVMYHANLLTCDIENATVHCISVCIIRSTRTFSPRNIKHYKPP